MKSNPSDSEGTGQEDSIPRVNSIGNKEMMLKQRRLRRCKSVSRAEEIVTEDEKQRRAQPDKPIHKPRDSIMSFNSGKQNFEGIINWAFLLLSIGGLRLFLENINKYGIRVNPMAWINAIYGQYHKDGEFPIFWMFAYSNVPMIFAWLLEKLIAAVLGTGLAVRVIPMCIILHVCNILHVIILPAVVMHQKYDQIGPAAGNVICAIYTIIFIKLWSYAQVNYWCRTSLRSKAGGATFDGRQMANRNNSMIELNPNPPNSTARRMRLKSEKKDSAGNVLVQYPDNLTLSDMYYFWFAPTLCYELNFPRSGRIRKSFLLRRALEVIVGTNIVLALIQQWIVPGIVNSLIPFSDMNIGKAAERILKLAVPNHLIWLTFFYLIFHSALNTVAEIMKFADRGFYYDWWNSRNIIIFWKTWNLPVHRWCVRHVYKPVMGMTGSNTLLASLIVFFLSAFLHEYVISIPLNIFKAYAFLGMMFQVPLMFISNAAETHIGPRAGNIIVWLSLMIGHPVGILMYYHDFVIDHYGIEEIKSFGQLGKF